MTDMNIIMNRGKSKQGMECLLPEKKKFLRLWVSGNEGK